MFSKGNDLERDYPEIAAFVNQNVRISAHHINGFLFKRRKRSVAGNLFRVTGEVSVNQVAALKKAHDVGSVQKLIIRKYRSWVEYSLPVRLEDVLLADTYTSDSMSRDLSDVLNNLGDMEDTEDAVYVNGRLIDSEVRRSSNINFGDTVVVLSDPEDFEGGSFLPFSEMPVLAVYQQKLLGPYSHSDFDGLWPKEIAQDRQLRRALRLDSDDEAICPECSRADCDGHVLRAGSKVYFRRPGTSKNIYSFASAHLVGDDASDLLVPFAPAVLGRRITGDKWPQEVYAVTIDGRDHTNSTCGEDIGEKSDVTVVLGDPRKRIVSR